MRTLALATGLVLTLLSACSRQKINTPSLPYEAAYYDPAENKLWIFPIAGSAVSLDLPFQLQVVKFGPDGKSLYGIETPTTQALAPSTSGILRISLDSMTGATISGSAGFVIAGFAISARQDRVVFRGLHPGEDREGIFEIRLPEGRVRQILREPVLADRGWNSVSLSPAADLAVVDHGRFMELVDLVRGTATVLPGQPRTAAWSPDGKSIAMIEAPNDQITLADGHDLSLRRKLGTVFGPTVEWSPDSRYLLVWKLYSFHCGFAWDVEPPATLEMIEVVGGRRSVIASSDCRLTLLGATGWIRRTTATGKQKSL